MPVPVRTLFISDTVPYPPNNGKRQRIFHLLRGVASRSEVTLVARTADAQGAREFAKAVCLRDFCCEVHLLCPADSRRPCDPSNLPAGLHWLRNVSNHLHPTIPALLRSSQSKAGTRFISRLCEQRFDLVWAETFISMALLPPRLAPRVIVDLDDIQHQKMAHKLRGGVWDALSPLHAVEFLKLRRLERNLWKLPYEFVVCSEGDKHFLNPGTRLSMIPNGVELPANTPFTNDAGKAPTILFVGTMCYAPNVDAAVHFARRILPLIRAQMPNAKFQIVGHEPTKEVWSLGSIDGVSVTGSVPSVESYLRQATVFVAPIRFGGGTRIKILEAMAHRKAIVSTSVGAEGIAAQSGEHLLLADDPAAFADACVLLLRSPEVRERIADEGNRLVRQRYTWGRIERSVADLASAASDPVLPMPSLAENETCQTI
jgi:polysaccharide biosynthesis protein PslH